MRSRFQLLFKDFADHGGVCLALAQFHDLAFERIQRGKLSVFVILDGFRVGGNDLVTEFFNRAGVADLGQALGFDDSGGGIAGGEHFGKNGLGDATADFAAVHQGGKFRDFGGFDLCLGEVSLGFRQLGA